MFYMYTLICEKYMYLYILQMYIFSIFKQLIYCTLIKLINCKCQKGCRRINKKGRNISETSRVSEFLRG